MKKIILLAFVFLESLISLCARESLPVRFVRRTMDDRPVLYLEELEFFSELSLYSYTILSKLGYVDGAGKWIKKTPKYSPLMELIRINRPQIYGGMDVEEIFYFGGEVHWYRDGRMGKAQFHTLACVILQAVKREDNKTIVIFQNNTSVNQKIDFPITINGEDLSRKLGFTDQDGILSLGNNALEELKRHLNKLETK